MLSLTHFNFFKVNLKLIHFISFRRISSDLLNNVYHLINTKNFGLYFLLLGSSNGMCQYKKYLKQYCINNHIIQHLHNIIYNIISTKH